MLSLVSFFISTAMAVTVSLMPSQTYVPQGFDTNDTNVQIGFDSMYPNTCYQYLPNQSSVSEDEKVIRIDNLSEHLDDRFCAKVIRYFDDIVSLGPIETEGVYDIQFLHPSGEYKSVGKIKIFKPEDSGSIDNELYAPLSEVTVRKTEKGVLAKLVAKSPYPCLAFTEIKMQVNGNTIVLLPIVDKPNCQAEDETYTITTETSLGNLKGRYLLHVRAMNSRAINKFIEL